MSTLKWSTAAELQARYRPVEQAIERLNLSERARRVVWALWSVGKPMTWPHIEYECGHDSEEGLRELTHAGIVSYSYPYYRFTLELPDAD